MTKQLCFFRIYDIVCLRAIQVVGAARVPVDGVRRRLNDISIKLGIIRAET